MNNSKTPARRISMACCWPSAMWSGGFSTGSKDSMTGWRTWTKKSTRSISASQSRSMPSNAGDRLQRPRHRNRRPQQAPNIHPANEHYYFSWSRLGGMAYLLHERDVHELAAFYQYSVPARENGASPQRRDSPGDCLREGPAQSLPLHRRERTQVQNAPLFRVRSGEPALHHGSQGRPEYRRKLR